MIRIGFCSLATLAALLTYSFVRAEEIKQAEPPKWLVVAEDALIGTWLNTNDATQGIPKVEIFRDGPLLVLFGILRFFIDQPAAPIWQRHTTSDGFASAEFPATPKATEQTDTINGVSAHRTSLTYDVPFKEISLFLSFSPIPPNEPNVPDTERIAFTKAHFIQQGFSIVREAPVPLGASTGFVLDLQRDGGKVRMWTRLAYVAGKVYRVVVSSTGSHHDDPIIPHYLESFRIERTGA